MTNPTELLPCGHCGSANVSMSFSATMECADPAARFVECEECAACGPPCDIIDGDDEDAKARAAAAWNTRAAPAPVASEEVERLIVELRATAESASRASRMMAEAKSRRNSDGERDDLYMWATPEQTVEGRAAAILAALSLTTPARAVSREEVAKLNALQDWLREPDHAERFGNREIFDWINRRPTHLVPAIIALIGGGE